MKATELIEAFKLATEAFKLATVVDEQPDHFLLRVEKPYSTDAPPFDTLDALAPEKPKRASKRQRTTEQIKAALGIERFSWWLEFWGAYPCHGGTRDAMDVFERKVRSREQFQLVIDGARRYAETIRRNPDRAVKWAQGWINAERWLDDPEPCRVAASSFASTMDPETARRLRERDGGN